MVIAFGIGEILTTMFLTSALTLTQLNVSCDSRNVGHPSPYNSIYLTGADPTDSSTAPSQIGYTSRYVSPKLVIVSTKVRPSGLYLQHTDRLLQEISLLPLSLW